ncbi:MAG: UTP--glucose-1-phosphate uridylyltransferase, partial [Elusimicrobia bacterium]|nr:UTP--glucose-1-phosphate uridylyltransferase [Elusimicrobiota bacterium]
MGKEFFKKQLITKSLSVIISVSLVITGLQGLSFAMPVSVNIMPTVMQNVEQINTNIIPFNVGRVTETVYNGRGKTLLLIQDLHAHGQTQKNISSILKILDQKYGIKNIWLEGAAGQLDTGWLANISDKSKKENIIKTLLENGMLTGAELFSVQTGKTKIIKGLENKEVYLKNFERLKNIYDNKDQIEEYLPKIKAILDVKTEKYFSIENKKINVLKKKLNNDKISSDKYLKYILKAAKKAGINLANYTQVVKYVYITEKREDINFVKVNKEIGKIVNELKKKLSYQPYKDLVEKANNKETETEFYTTLKKLAEENGILAEYKEAAKFFAYIEYNEMLNPIQLAMQEDELINDIEMRFARNGYEKEVLFLQKYFRLIENYLSNKITADDYRYFMNNETKFKELWIKYVDVDGIIDINKYFGLFDNFYKDNVERNRYFIENITGTKPAKEKDAVIIKGSDEYNAQAIEELSREKDGIDVVITGGFHTRGLSRLFDEENINYIVITPNVTEETVTCEKLYEQMFRAEYEVVKEKFSLMPISALLKTRIFREMRSIDDIKLVDNRVEFYSQGKIIGMIWQLPGRGFEIVSYDENGIVDNERLLYRSEELVEDKETGEKYHPVYINGQIVDRAAYKQRQLTKEQAKIVAATFLDIQQLFRINRENARRTDGIVQDTSDLKSKIREEISKITDSNIKDLFVAKSGIDVNVMQSNRTIERLEKIARFLRLSNPENFKFSPVGMFLGAVMEPFVGFWSEDKFRVRHGGEMTDEQKFGRSLVGVSASIVLVLATFVAFGPVLGGSLATMAALNVIGAIVAKIATVIGVTYLTDVVMHFIYNTHALQLGWELMQTGEKVSSVEVATGMKYERGEITNDVVEFPMRPTEQLDVFDPTKLSEEEQLSLERKGVEALLSGKVSLSMLIAGASSRMNVNEAPQAIKDVVASGKTGTGGTMGSKAAVPITADGITYLEAFLLNITRLQEQIKQLAEKYGVDANKLIENEILLMTNEDYRTEHEAMLRSYYGTDTIPESVRLFEQPLGAKYIANLSDTRKMKSKFENPQDYYKALWYSAQIALASKENPDAILSQERDPLGHGEYFHQLIESGELMHLILSGKQFIYVKNVDNYAAKFDRTFLIELGYFVQQSEEKGLNFLSEVSQRVAGLKGGSWFVDQSSGSQFAVEDPTLKATIADVKSKAEAARKAGDIKEAERLEKYAEELSVPSFGFNDAVAFYTPEYVANLYLQDGQTIEDFIVEYDAALKEKEKGNLVPIQEIAQRGRSKFPQLLDPKPAKTVVKGQKVPENLSIYEGILTAEEIAAISAF